MYGSLRGFRRRAPLGLVVPIIALLAAACGSASTPLSEPTAIPTGPPSSTIEPILATKVLRVGAQRVSFLLTTPESLIKAPEATVRSEFLGGEDAQGETKIATFHLWPYGVRGAYSTELTFDRPGRWRLDISVDREDGPGEAQLVVDVAEEVGIPEIGTIPPLSRSKTLYDVDSIEELTSDFTPDPDLYQLTIAEAVISGRPTVVVMSSPFFCTSPTCGPQTDTVSDLKDRHKGDANFIHVEVYDNPGEIREDLSKGILSPVLDEWGISKLPGWFNESWTFVLGSDGRIAQRFEGFASLEELEEALQAVLPRG